MQVIGRLGIVFGLLEEGLYRDSFPYFEAQW